VNCEKLAQCDTNRETYGCSYSQNCENCENCFVLRQAQSVATPYRSQTLEFYSVFESGLNQARCNQHVCWNRHRKSQFNTNKVTHETAEPGYYHELLMKRNISLQLLAYILAYITFVSVFFDRPRFITS
jgi:hypothetical protein